MQKTFTYKFLGGIADNLNFFVYVLTMSWQNNYEIEKYFYFTNKGIYSDLIIHANILLPVLSLDLAISFSGNFPFKQYL